jgi:hypothetical protein
MEEKVQFSSSSESFLMALWLLRYTRGMLRCNTVGLRDDKFVRISYEDDDHHPDDGGSKHLWNVGKLAPDYTAQ